VNGRTAFSDAMTTTFVAVLLLAVVTGSPDDGYGVWLARFSGCLAVSYLAWRAWYRRK
jgi:hypothetical protein